MKKQIKQAFTLIELIVVITILAILGTIAFISLQGYSSQARDSRRISDIQNIKKSLELFSLNTGQYPKPDSLVTISYGSQKLWYQGKIGDQVSTNLSRNLNKKPTDPLTENEYTYSRTYAGNEYELLSIYESELVSFLPHPNPPLTGEGTRKSVISSIYASNTNYPKISGNYNGVYVKAGTYYLPTPSIINALNTDLDLATQTDGLLSQIITGGDNNIANAGFEATTGGLTGMSVEVFTGTLDTDKGEDDNGNKVLLAQILINAYSGSILANNGIYKEIAETSNEDLIKLVDTYVLNKDNFTNTSSSSNEGTTPSTLITQTECEEEAGWYWVSDTLDTMGDGFCISPRIEGNGDTYGISWNDTGTYATRRAWDNISYATTEGLADNEYGITAYLSSYTCKPLNSGSENVDLTYGDTIIGRMKRLSGFSNMDNNYTALNNIDWINITLNTSSVFPIPSIYIADCIDGEKDLTTDMILGAETITWSNYTSTTDSEATRITRNKYLLGWAKSSGSHLPSAYSSIDYEIGDNLTGDARGEYQVACENNATIGGDLTTDNSNERIWLSAVGYTDGTNWGRDARLVGYNGCGDQTNGNAGGHYTTDSARFVVRP